MKTQIVYKVGETVWKQQVELIKEVDGTFTIKKHAYNQRDETDLIRGLDAQTIRNMIKAVDMVLVDNKQSNLFNK